MIVSAASATSSPGSMGHVDVWCNVGVIRHTGTNQPPTSPSLFELSVKMSTLITPPPTVSPRTAALFTQPRSHVAPSAHPVVTKRTSGEFRTPRAAFQRVPKRVSRIYSLSDWQKTYRS